MKLFKSSMPFSALGIIFILLGVAFADPKQFSFGLVWFLIAAAKIFLIERSSKVKRSN
jgi:hypothetical protein